MYEHALLLTGAGSSSRFRNGKKEFLSSGSKTVLSRAASAFSACPGLAAVVVTYRKGTLEETKKAMESFDSSVPVYYAEGGKTRRESVFSGLRELSLHVPSSVLVSIHDGARPFASPALVEKCLICAGKYGSAVPALPSRDTLAVVKDGVIESYADRESVFSLQTPQVFRLSEILSCHEKAQEEGFEATDDTSLFRRYIGAVHTVEGERSNVKITFPEDTEYLK